MKIAPISTDQNYQKKYYPAFCKSKAFLKQDSFIGRLDKFCGKLFGTPKSLDNHNKLKIDSED